MVTTPRSRIVLVAVAACMLLLAACSPRPEELIVGKWDSEVLVREFLKDGTMTMTIKHPPPAPPIQLSGKWGMEGSDKVKLVLEVDGEEQQPDYMLVEFPDRDTMIMRPANARRLYLEFKRVGDAGNPPEPDKPADKPSDKSSEQQP